MGRGRAKAKQIKVARKLKYSAPDTDLSALERELHSTRGEFDYSPPGDEVDDDDDLDPEDDSYAEHTDDERGDDYGSWAAGGR
ncbi:hypothetical protein SGUI_2527 [Serinicoccus hydrothermalis]|uniref:DUF3073 domain-containing protein n=1 Tax=Serinicoccus hydrothermalis TaxID=1758689 RepID=A0A1B1NEU5_9MICO|nr:DUF3073 domain-containing protein [Serinicoccus hydrothermalis]ANS79923.1 hypothetical protein SGUI_2527 [Serinicoccus hydrothermalis]